MDRIKSPSILLVSSAGKKIEKQLTRIGYASYTVRSVAGALAELAAPLPRLILVHLQRDEMRLATKITRSFRSRFDIPILFLVPHNARLPKPSSRTASLNYVPHPLADQAFSIILKLALETSNANWSRFDQKSFPALSEQAFVSSGCEQSERLCHNEQRYRDAIIVAGLVPYFIDYDTNRFTFIGEDIIKLTGYSHEEITPHILKASVQKDYIWGPNANLTPNEARQQFRSGEIREWRSDMLIRTRTGESRWLSDTSVEIQNEQGKVIGAIGIFQDITERKHAEEEVRARERHLTILNEIARIGSSTFDFDEMVQLFADRAAEIIGADACYITLWDETKQRTIPTAAYGPLREVYRNLPPNEPGRLTITHTVMTTGHSLVVEDVGNSPYANKRLGVHLPSQSLLGLPLIAGTRKLGAILVGFDTGHRFTKDEILRSEQMANQISLALSNARLFQQTKRRANEFATLYEIASDLGAQRDLPAVLELIVARAQSLLNAPAAGIFLYDAARNELERAVSHGLPSDNQAVRLKIGQGMAGRVAQSRQWLIVDDYKSWENRAVAYEGMPIAGVVQVPMLFGGELVGVLSVGEHYPDRKFNAEDARLLTLFATQAASAIYNARLLREAERRAQEFSALYESSGELSKSRDNRTILQTIVDRATILLGASHGTLYTINPKAEVITLQAAKNFVPPKLTQKMDEGLLGQVAQSRRTMLIDDYSQWHGRMQEFNGVPLRSSLQVPMLYGGKLLGILGVGEHGESDRKFTRADADLLELFAVQAASAVHNAQLNQEMRRRIFELEAINKISTALRVAKTLEAMLPDLLEETLDVVGTNAGAIRLWDPKNRIFGEVRRGWLLGTEFPPKKLMDGIAGYVLKTGNTYRAREFRSDPKTRESARAQIPPGWGGVCVPVRAGMQIVGIMFVSVELPRELDNDEVHLLTTLAEIAGSAIDRTRLDQSLEETYLQTIRALASTVDARDSYTGIHSDRLAQLGVALAQELKMSKEEQDILRFAAYLHDIGKIAIPDSVLRKPGPLSEDEWKLIRQHPIIGAHILEPLRHLQSVVPIVRHHQEHYDGTGYPEGLKGEAIPLSARILKVVDAYSAMTDDRVYQKGCPHEQAVQELRNKSGTQFDPNVVEAFLHLKFEQ